MEVARPRVSLAQIFMVFAKVSLTSFGGGLSGWMYREFVEARSWFTDAEFLSSLAICQAMPGVNVVNLAVWLGFRLRGTLGAIVGFCAMIVPALIVIIPIAIAYSYLGKYPVVHHALAGIAAAALALTLNMVSRVAVSAVRDGVTLAIVAIIFVGIGLLQWPMFELVIVIAPLSIAWAFYRQRTA
ncbi:MAG: chromate transporter [Vulcanimicrobiaceae bacterium]